jgi:hypothetical protein
MAFCISGIVASTTLNGRRAFEGLTVFARSCPDKLAVVQARMSSRKLRFIVRSFYIIILQLQFVLYIAASTWIMSEVPLWGMRSEA